MLVVTGSKHDDYFVCLGFCFISSLEGFLLELILVWIRIKVSLSFICRITTLSSRKRQQSVVGNGVGRLRKRKLRARS